MPKQLNSESEFSAFIGSDRVTLVHFYASWAPQCEQLNVIIDDLLADSGNSFDAAFVDAEGVPAVSLANKVTAAPTVVFFKEGTEKGRVNGFHPAELRATLSSVSDQGAAAPVPGSSDPKENLNDRLRRLITSKRLMLFMKGDAAAPKCGFSRQTVDLLNGVKADFGTFDILQDETVRQGLKEYSNWPTYPQLYLDGELVGGLDVIREEMNDPEFVAKLPKKETLNDRLKRLTTASKLMLFMKGNAEAPRCGFSRQTVDLLNGVKADFKTFDILSDDAVRQGLKEYSNWPTYPQLYLDGELVGGLDVIREELQDAEFVARLPKKA